MQGRNLAFKLIFYGNMTYLHSECHFVSAPTPWNFYPPQSRLLEQILFREEIASDRQQYFKIMTSLKD